MSPLRLLHEFGDVPANSLADAPGGRVCTRSSGKTATTQQLVDGSKTLFRWFAKQPAVKRTN